MASNKPTKKPSKIVEAEKNRWVATIDGWSDFFNWMAYWLFGVKGTRGIKIKDDKPSKVQICLDSKTAWQELTGPAFRLVDDRLTDCRFCYNGSFYTLDDQKVGTGTWYLNINRSNPSASAVSSNPRSGNYVNVPLISISGIDQTTKSWNVANSWLGCPSITEKATSTYWYADNAGYLRGCVAFLGVGGSSITASNVKLPDSGYLYANISFDSSTPTMSVSSSSSGDISILVASVSSTSINTLNAPLILPVYV